MLPLSNHARYEMQKRDISEIMVESVFLQPVQKIIVSKDRQIWQNKIEIEGKAYIMRLVVEINPAVKIITVYKSSKVDKYWRIEK